jgi:hypothetical protein
MDKATLRQKVREVLGMVPAGRMCTESMLIESARRLVPFDVSDDEVRDAIEWNQQRGFVDFRYDAEAEVDSYFLTERGKGRE